MEAWEVDLLIVGVVSAFGLLSIWIDRLRDAIEDRVRRERGDFGRVK